MSEHIKQHSISVTKTARYCTIGEPSANTKEVWFVCHGQGQLATYFIKHFQGISQESRLIVAPEALSKFYLDNMGSRIGACWMTREDRLNEIDNYVNYLDRVYDQVLSLLPNQDIKLQVLGFSQGAATICRWVVLGKPKPVEKLILWGGLTPPDLDLKPLSQLKLFLVVGQQDQYANDEIVNKEEERLKENQLNYKKITFAGGHQLNTDVIKQLAES